MTYAESLFLALIQGLTEFLPVSSSGHLALASSLMKVPEGGLAFNIILHLGTLVAVIAFYGKDMIKIASGVVRRDPSSIRLCLTLVLATVPVAVFGILAGDFIEGLFQSVLFVSLALSFTGAVLFIFGNSGSGSGDERASMSQGVKVGLAQTLALFPGVSRSGITISAGLATGLSREEAARFSFLLAIPAITGAAVKELPAAQWTVPPGILLAGFAVSALVGFLALSVLVRFVKKGRLRGFAWYCWAVAAVGIAIHFST